MGHRDGAQGTTHCTHNRRGISKNWQGKPLVSLPTMLNYIRTTQTKSGLEVHAHLLRKKYQKGEPVTDKQFNQLPLSRNRSLPDWNYTLAPTNGEVIFS